MGMDEGMDPGDMDAGHDQIPGQGYGIDPNQQVNPDFMGGN